MFSLESAQKTNRFEIVLIILTFQIRRLTTLLRTLKIKNIKEIPSVFDFDGSADCGISIPPFKLSGAGFSFFIWMKLEPEEFLLKKEHHASLLTYSFFVFQHNVE